MKRGSVKKYFPVIYRFNSRGSRIVTGSTVVKAVSAEGALVEFRRNNPHVRVVALLHEGKEAA